MGDASTGWRAGRARHPVSERPLRRVSDARATGHVAVLRPVAAVDVAVGETHCCDGLRGVARSHPARHGPPDARSRGARRSGCRGRRHHLARLVLSPALDRERALAARRRVRPRYGTGRRDEVLFHPFHCARARGPCGHAPDSGRPRRSRRRAGATMARRLNASEGRRPRSRRRRVVHSDRDGLRHPFSGSEARDAALRLGACVPFSRSWLGLQLRCRDGGPRVVAEGVQTPG